MLGKFTKYILVTSFFAFSGNVVFSEQSPEVKLLAAGFEEFLRNSANISGAVVSGLQRQGTVSSNLELGAYIPVDWAGSNACMQVVSSDGRYEAFGPYTIPADWPGGFSPLEFPTVYQPDLKRLESDELGALLSRGGCSDRGKGEVSVSLWNTAPGPAYALMLNSFRADQVYLYKKGLSKPAVCERVDVSSPIAYDTKCNIELGDRSEQSVFTIYRVKDGKPSKPTEVKIWLPKK